MVITAAEGGSEQSHAILKKALHGDNMRIGRADKIHTLKQREKEEQWML